MPSDLSPSKRTVLAIMADLANGLTSSRELIEAALAQIADPAGEGARTFVKVYGDSARAVADAQDRLRKAGYIASPLAGLPVSLKDTMLSRAGARIVDLPLSELAELPAINASGGFAPIEAYAWHKPLLERHGSEYDPRVRTRIERASGMTAVEYIRLRAARADLINRVAARTSGFDALLMPTVAITAPPIAAFERD